jgi:hypothetical protein
MKQVKSSAARNPSDVEQRPRGGKRSLYDPKLGASNYRKAEDGRFARHPAFIACKKLWGVFYALSTKSGAKKNNRRWPAIAKQMENALCSLRDEATRSKGRSDKLRFAEAVGAFFDPPKTRDETALLICWRAIELRTNERPSQAEVRYAVEQVRGKKFLDYEWKRWMKRLGLNKKLPTQREKTQRGILRKV